MGADVDDDTQTRVVAPPRTASGRKAASGPGQANATTGAAQPTTRFAAERGRWLRAPVFGRPSAFMLFAAYLACVPFANWLIGHVGTVCVPDGPCLMPVAPGILAPSGVIAAGAALVLRDLVQRTAGLGWSVFAVACGTLVSLGVSPPSLVLASGSAFALSEIADLAVYTPLQRRGLVWAVLASGAVGAAIDSALFLGLAFGTLDHLTGQVVGKLEAVALAAVLIGAVRSVRPETV